MFPQLKKINNESGVVLFVVLMSAVIIMVYSLAILIRSMNEINYSQQQIDQITGQQLSKGVIFNALSTNTLSSGNFTTNLNGRIYTIIKASSPANATTNTWQVTTNYDTFQ